MVSGINVVINTKVQGLKESIQNELKDVGGLVKESLSALEFGKAFLNQDFSAMDAYSKRRAYDAEMANSGDEDKAKAAADSAGFSKSQLELLGLVKELGSSLKSVGNSITGFIQGMFGVVEEIYKQMKKSSPLLEMIENLFNIAMQLFFMPLGNKLAEVMLPAIINMLDAVMDIWDKFEGKSLGEMFSIAITEGVQLVATYLMDLGSLLENEGGIVGSIGSLLSTIGNFLADDGARIIEFLAKVFEFLMNNVGKLILAATEFFIASLAIQTAIFFSLSAYFAQGFLSKIPVIGGLGPATIGLGAGATVAGGTNILLFGTGLGGDLLGMAEGGYVPATPGGKAIRVAEAGEGEYVIPESKFNDVISLANVLNSSVQSYNTPESQYMVPMTNATSQTYEMNQSHNMQREITNNFYFEGLTNDDLKMIIREEVDNMVSQSKYRGGF